MASIQLNGVRVQQLREERGWSRKRLARELARLWPEGAGDGRRLKGTSERTVRRAEEGLGIWRESAELIAQALGVPLEELRAPGRAVFLDVMFKDPIFDKLSDGELAEIEKRLGGSLRKAVPTVQILGVRRGSIIFRSR